MSAEDKDGGSTDLPGQPGIGPAEGEWHHGWLRVAIALVLAGQGMAFGLAANMTPPTGGAYWVLHGGLAASAVAVFGLLGGPLVRETVASLLRARITVDLLFLLTLSGALGVSVFSTLRREGPVFYELVAILLAIYTVGKLLGARSRARALRAVDELRAEHDRCVQLMSDGSTRVVRACDVAPGDRVRVTAGEAIAVDGRVAVGRSLIQTTPLTGEPHPVEAGPGHVVLAGMRVVDGVLVIEAASSGGNRRIDAMLRAIEEARLRPSRLQDLADRLSARFVPLVVLVSAGALVYWWEHGGMVPAIENSLAVLVVACPCALGLATPLGIWAGLVKLGRLGLVARSGDFLDALAGATRAVFDKTGTLCEPELRAIGLTFDPASPVHDDVLPELLAVAETGLDHPVAEALRAAWPGAERGGGYDLVETRVVPGFGVRAQVRRVADGFVHTVLAGSEAFMAESGVPPDATLRACPERCPELRTVWVAVDGRSAARVDLDETPREWTTSVFEELRHLGLKVEILTGDPAFPETRWSGVPRRVGLAPEEKAAHIRQAQEGGESVLFIGDGMNDAPALAVADTSIAVRQGAGLARSNALAVVDGGSLGTLPEAVRVARAMRRAIRTNLLFAACYNTAGMGIAAAGWLDPILAALLMAGSSAIVSTRVLRAS